ncbi:ABC transporter substrate-binding protein [Halobellus rubicundus]|uniref:ABC transporter substrate-binding protein n=1 Tax=Halobellus rubicundus TaxID=2996466 RepID=A0ABD5MJZ1_9EURY
MAKETSSRIRNTRRRTFIKTAGTAVTLAGLAGCSSGGNGGGGGDTETSGGDGGGDGQTGTTTSPSLDGPVRVGLLTPLSGPFALTGQEVQRGVEMAREHLGGEILGQSIEVVSRDSEGSSSGALEGARSLVEQEDVDAIIGPSISSAGLAVLPYIRDQAQIPILPTQVSSVNAREGENCTDYSYFIWVSNRHTVPVGVDFIYDLQENIDRDYNPDQVHFFAPDYALGQNNLELLREEMSSRGGEVVGSTLAPIGTQDLSSYISELSNSEADVITGVLTPGMAVRLINQATDFGLPDEKIMMFNSGKPVDQITQASVGATADGWYGTYFYNPASESEINQAFMDLYPSESDLLPNASCGSGFETMRAIAQSIEQGGSTNPDDMVDQLGGLSWESIFGPAQFREGDGQIELNFVGATRQDTEFTVLEEYPDIIPENRC